MTKVPRFCISCGTQIPPDTVWPYRCLCNHVTYLNVPVASNLIVPISSSNRLGVLMVRRAIHPGYGKLGLPGGYTDHGETWKEGALRELYEECGIVAPTAEMKLFRVTHTAGKPMVVHAVPRFVWAEDQIPSNWEDPESFSREVVYSPQATAFRGHDYILEEFFDLVEAWRSCRQGRNLSDKYLSWWESLDIISG